MTRWSMVAEFLAFIILVILFMRYYLYERHVTLTARRKYYLACLAASAFSIPLNLICVYMMERPVPAPLWVNVILNSLYFTVSMVMCFMLAFYLFQQMLEHVYDKHCLHRAYRVVIAITGFYILVVFWNIPSGVLFSFDSQMNYHRGILNPLGYVLMVAELVFLFVCSDKHLVRKCVKSKDFCCTYSNYLPNI